MTSTLRLLVLALAVLVSSRGGGNDDSPSHSGRPAADWTRDACTAYQTWAEGISARTMQMNEDLTTATPDDFTELRDLLVASFDDYIVLTDQAAEAVRGAGQPAVENGGQIASAFSSILVDFNEVLTAARMRARDLPVDNPDAFVRGARELANGLPKQLDLSTPFRERLPDSAPSELREAFANEPACELFGVETTSD